MEKFHSMIQWCLDHAPFIGMLSNNATHNKPNFWVRVTEVVIIMFGTSWMVLDKVQEQVTKNTLLEVDKRIENKLKDNTKIIKDHIDVKVGPIDEKFDDHLKDFRSFREGMNKLHLKEGESND